MFDCELPAISLRPSADEAMAAQIILAGPDSNQVAPEFVERYIGPGRSSPATAASFTPSAEDATEAHLVIGAEDCVQVIPESGEV